MRNVGKLALFASLFLTLGGWEAVSAHALRPAFPTLLSKNVRQQQEAALIAKIRDVQVIRLKHHITHTEALLISYKSFAGNKHSYLARTGRAQLVAEAVVNRDENRAKLLESLREVRP
jgi:hypothetical protein